MGEEESDELVVKPKTESPVSEKTEDLASFEELTIDQVIDDYVGSFGFSQFIQVFLVSLAWIFDSQNNLVTIFSDAEPRDWRCNKVSDSLCLERLVKKGSSVPGSVCGLEPGSWEWVEGGTSSIVAEWGLICDRKLLAAIPASCFFIGTLTGAAGYGKLADSILGRKRTLMLSCLLTSITAFLTSLSPTFWTYAMLRFANGLARSGIGTCCLVLSTEVVGRKWRGQVGQYGFFLFTVGFMSVPLIAYPTRTSWRALYRIISIFPLFYSLFVLPFVVESPRWLLIRGRKMEALEVLMTFARRNGRRVPSDIQLTDPTLLQSDEGKNSNMGLWECKWARILICKVMLVGLSVGFLYYGIQLNVENLNFSKYLTVAINALMEIPAVFLGSFLLSSLPRRQAFSLPSYIAGASCLLCTLFTGSVQLGVEAVAFMAASTAFSVLYIYSVELFPTNVRNMAVALLDQALMLGASMAPLVVVVGRLSSRVSFLVFGGVGVVSGVMSLWLPETMNVRLYETLEEQEEEKKTTLYGGGESCEFGVELCDL